MTDLIARVKRRLADEPANPDPARIAALIREEAVVISDIGVLDVMRKLRDDTTGKFVARDTLGWTATKPDAPQPLGIDGFARARALSALPAVAIGGIRPEDVAGLMAAGADGVAVVSGICAAADPRLAAQTYRREIQR